MVHPRIARARLSALLRQFPAVAVLGPRQIGKSTLARWALPGYAYLDLENPLDHDRLAHDPPFVLAQHQRLIIDEAQRFAPLFPALRSFIDQNPRRKVVLLGSASPELVTQVSESLTGRIGIFELGAISVFENNDEELWLRGGFPRIHWSSPRAKPEDWYPSYLRTSLSQDVPELGFRVSPLRMRTLLTMLAHAQGSVCNLSELGASLGVNYHAVAHLLDIFQGIFLVRRLAPFFTNIRKRLVKSPKLYVRDTGLLHSLLGLRFTRQALLSHPKAGASFETFCLEQILGHARLADAGAEGFFFRTHSGQEVDLLLKLRGRLIPIEVKLGISPPDTRSLESCIKDLGLSGGYVVNLSSEPIEIRRDIWMCGLRALLERLGLRPKA